MRLVFHYHIPATFIDGKICTASYLELLKLIPRGKNWYYLNLAEMDSLLRNFAAKEIRTTGFFSALVPRPEWLKNFVARFDLLFFFLPKNWRYVCFGYAVKQLSI